MSQGMPADASEPRQPARTAKLVFWVAVILWIGSCALTAFMVPVLTALQPSLEAGLSISILVPIVLLLAVNIAAIYPAFIYRGLRNSPLVTIAWVVSIVVAALGDIAFLWGIFRLVLLGPSFA